MLVQRTPQIQEVLHRSYLFLKETLKNLPRTGIEATSFGADVVDNLTRSQSYRRYYCVTYVFFPKKILNKRNTPLTLH